MTAPQRAPAGAPARRVAAAPAARPERSRQPHLRLVRPEESRRRVSPALGVVLTALAFVSLFALAGAHAVLVQSQLRLDGVEADLAVERARYQELRVQVAELESPGRVVSAARDRLGMVPPAELLYLTPVLPSVTGPAGDRTELAGPGGGAAPDQAGDEAWSAVKPLLDAVTP